MCVPLVVAGAARSGSAIASAQETAVATESASEPPAAEVSDWHNVGSEVVGGILGRAVGVALGLGLIVSFGDPEYADEFLFLWAIVTGTFLDAVATAGGIEIGGSAGEQDGSYWAAFGGHFAGGALALGVFALFGGFDARDSLWIPITAMITFPIIGGIVAYEMTDDASVRR